MSDLFSLESRAAEGVAVIGCCPSSEVVVPAAVPAVAGCREFDMNGVISSSSGNDTYVEIFL